MLAWSGRADPDGNLFSFDGCKQPLNYAGYCNAEVDDLLEPVAHAARSGRAQEALRADRRAGAEGPADHLPLPPQLAVGLHGQARRRAQRARRPAPRRRAEARCPEQRRDAAHWHAATMFDFLVKRLGDDRADALLRLDADLRAAAAAARRPGEDPGRRGAGPDRHRLPARRSCTSTSRCRCATPTGSAACCAATSASRCAPSSRCASSSAQKLPVTLELAVLAMIIALVIGIPAGIVSAVGRGTAWDYGRQRLRALGPVDAELLARHPADPALLGAARLAAGLGLREPVRGPAREPRRDDHAGLRARQRDRRGADAAHAQRDAAGALGRLRAHRARQGPARAARSCSSTRCATR